MSMLLYMYKLREKLLKIAHKKIALQFIIDQRPINYAVSNLISFILTYNKILRNLEC